MAHSIFVFRWFLPIRYGARVWFCDREFFSVTSNSISTSKAEATIGVKWFVYQQVDGIKFRVIDRIANRDHNGLTLHAAKL